MPRMSISFGVQDRLDLERPCPLASLIQLPGVPIAAVGDEFLLRMIRAKHAQRADAPFRHVPTQAASKRMHEMIVQGRSQ